MVAAIEPVPIPDIYVDDIAGVELLGTNVRITYFTWANGERVVVCKMVRPIETLRIGAIRQMIEAARHVALHSAAVGLH